MQNPEPLISNNLALLEHSAYLHRKLFTAGDLAAYHQSMIKAVPVKLETDEGIICFTPLEWDTRMFGVPVGRIDYILTPSMDTNAEIAAKVNLLEAIGKEYPDHYIFSRLDTRNITSIYALENAGFNMVDGIETFYFDIQSFAPYASENKDVIFRGALPGDEIELGEIGRDLYIYDRFHNDNLIPKPVADEVHAEWLRNSALGIAANHVAIAELDGRIASFATCKISVLEHLNITLGIIVLVGTRKEFQGKGLGKEITKYALNWFKEQQVDVVQIKTQLANIPAAKTYIESDFKLLNTELTFRKYKKI